MSKVKHARTKCNPLFSVTSADRRQFVGKNYHALYIPQSELTSRKNSIIVSPAQEPERRNVLILKPRLIIATGMATGGKTTVAKGLVHTIPNAVYLDRDGAMYGGLLVVNNIEERGEHLPSFEEYVGRDKVFPDFVETIENPFGRMHRVIHSNHSDFFWRHADRQSYLVTARFAEENLKLGKVALIDAWFSPKDFRNGTVREFLLQPAFGDVPRYLIFVAVEFDEAFRRWHARSEEDAESDLRAKSGYLDQDTFIEKMRSEQPAHPEGLDKIPHLRLDTTNISIQQSVATALDYVSS